MRALVIGRRGALTEPPAGQTRTAGEAHFLRRSIEIEIARLLALSHDAAVIDAPCTQLSRQAGLAASKD